MKTLEEITTLVGDENLATRIWKNKGWDKKPVEKKETDWFEVWKERAEAALNGNKEYLPLSKNLEGMIIHAKTVQQRISLCWYLKKTGQENSQMFKGQIEKIKEQAVTINDLYALFRVVSKESPEYAYAARKIVSIISNFKQFLPLLEYLSAGTSLYNEVMDRMFVVAETYEAWLVNYKLARNPKEKETASSKAIVAIANDNDLKNCYFAFDSNSTEFTTVFERIKNQGSIDSLLDMFSHMYLMTRYNAPADKINHSKQEEILTAVFKRKPNFQEASRIKRYVCDYLAYDFSQNDSENRILYKKAENRWTNRASRLMMKTGKARDWITELLITNVNTEWYEFCVKRVKEISSIEDVECYLNDTESGRRIKAEGRVLLLKVIAEKATTLIQKGKLYKMASNLGLQNDFFDEIMNLVD